MSYRDDHDAALARADALDEELDLARKAHARDEARIAALEAQLAEAQASAPPRRAPKPKTLDTGTITSGSGGVRRWLADHYPLWLSVGLTVVIFAGILIYHQARARKIANGWDVDAYLPRAVAAARDEQADVELSTIDADYVDAQGRAQLKYGGILSYHFRSPSRAQLEPVHVPPGAPTPPAPWCVLRAYIRRASPELSVDTYSNDCGESLPTMPRCTIHDVWARALASGAPPDGLASIDMRTERVDGVVRRRWKFSIPGADRYTLKFLDDCGAPGQQP